MNAEKKLKGKSNALFCVLSLVLLVVLLFPLYWILVTSLKTEQEIFRIPPTLFPSVLNTDSYAAQLQSGDFNMFQSFGNSMIIALSCTAIAVILSVPASYGLARFRFRGKKVCILSFLITQMLPVSVILTPMFIIFKNMSFGIPFSVLILKNYFGSIPKELEDAASIDGCNRFSAFLRIFVPIALPGVVVCAIFSFLYAWGDLAYGMTFIQDQVNRPITAGIFNFMGQYGTKWSYLTAFAVVTIIPVALIFIFMQKYIISGLTAGAVKG